MEILTRKKCTTCDGDGMVTTGIWLKYYEADTDFKSKHKRSMDEEEMMEWFSSQGVTKLPTEEIQCAECNGTGKIESWITVEQLLKEQYKEIFKYITGNGNQ